MAAALPFVRRSSARFDRFVAERVDFFRRAFCRSGVSVYSECLAPALRALTFGLLAAALFRLSFLWQLLALSSALRSADSSCSPRASWRAGVVGDAPRPRSREAAEAFDLRSSAARRGVRLLCAHPVTDEQAGDQAQQQHGEQAEQARVAPQPAGGAPRAGSSGGRSSSRRRRSRASAPRPAARRLGLQHVEEREPHGRGTVARRTGSSAGRRPAARRSSRRSSRAAADGNGTRLMARSVGSSERAADVVARARRRAAPRRPARRCRTRRGRRGT